MFVLIGSNVFFRNNDDKEQITSGWIATNSVKPQVQRKVKQGWETSLLDRRPSLALRWHYGS